MNIRFASGIFAAAMAVAVLAVPATAAARDMSNLLSLGVSYTPVSTYFAPNAQFNIRYGFMEDFFAEVDTAFVFGEDHEQGLALTPLLGMVFASVANANFYGAVGFFMYAGDDEGRAFPAAVAAARDHGEADKAIDMMAVEFGPGFEYFMGDELSMSFYAEYMGMLYFEPQLVFAFTDGLRLGMRFNFSL